MEDYCQNHFKAYKQQDGVITGFLESESEYDKFKDYLCKFGYSFSVRNSRNRTNSKVTDASSSQQHLVDHNYATKDSTQPIKFDYGSGIFYYGGELIYMVCAHGSKYYKKDAAVSHQDHPTTKRSRFSIQNTKKMDCPAVLQINERFVFQDHTISGKIYNSLKRKEEQKIRQQIAEGDHPAVVTRYYVKLSMDHNHDVTMQNMNIHPKISKKIHELVGKGFTSVKDIKLHLTEKVNEIFPEGRPEEINSCYYPKDNIIYWHIAEAIYKIKKSKFDQEALQFAIEKWQNKTPDSSFYFRPYQKDNSSLLFCYQAPWQKEMMKSFGNNICLLDATYKTTKYSLPLFFIVVKTNINYCVVGTFVCHTESTSAISEALDIFATWNKEWQPPYFMTDYCEAEINAINSVFPQCCVYLCAFHREQAWMRWVKKSGNIAFGKSDEVLAMFRDIAKTKSTEEYDNKIKELDENPLWKKNEQVVSYFTKQWLSIKERWVTCFMEHNYSNNVTTNNGIESQNNVLKHSFLSRSSDKSLTGMLTVIIEQYLPSAHLKIVKTNVEFSSSSKKYNDVIPTFLHNRPHKYIRHVFMRYETAKEELAESDVKKIEENIYHVQNSNKDGIYEVDFNKVLCTCADYVKNQQICKHFCACFLYTQNSFYTLPEAYRNNPLFNLDVSASGNSETIKNDEEVSIIKTAKSSRNEHKKLQQTLREVLKEGINLSYDIDDIELLQSAIKNAMENNKILSSLKQLSTSQTPQSSNDCGATKRKNSETEEIPQRKKKIKRLSLNKN